MKKLAFASLGLAGVLALLIYAEGILIPLVFGVILWFLGKSFKKLVEKIPFIKKRLPGTLVNIIVFVLLVVLIGVLSKLITSNVDSLLLSYDSYKLNIDKILEMFNERFHVDVVESVTKAFEGFEYGEILTNIANSISSIFGDTIIILVYAAFMFSEETSFKLKLEKMFRDKKEYARVNGILSKIGTSFSDYIRLKTYVSLMTGGVGYVFLLIMGVDSPFFWALLMFLLNYIPTIGSLIATLFPAIFSLMQFGDYTPFLIILVGLGIIEWIIGNVIEPKLMGNSLNLSPLVTILALIVWGQIWGITGMLLSTPITVVMVIVFSQFENTRSVAIMLSQNGDIDSGEG
ncbi:MAG: AI-2E family transporter [Roseivirga sp.]|nr:AI-2E family transporter [Roseivirga sp.]